jgi:hypothetical protein
MSAPGKSGGRLGGKSHRETCEPVGARALAGIAAEPDEHVREVHKPPNAHTNKRFCSRMIFRSGLPSCRDPQIFRGRTRAGEGRTQPGKCEPGEPQRCLQRHSSGPTSPIEGTPVSSSLVKLYEQHARECAEAAERTDDPVQRVILLRMAREWMEDAAAIASTLPEPERTGSRGPSGNRAA